MISVVVTRTWGSSLQRVEFQRSVATTGKVEIPDSAKKETVLQDHN